MIALVPVRMTCLSKTRGLAPVTVMSAPIYMSAALAKMRLARGFVPPTAPPKVIVSDDPAAKVKASLPSSVLSNWMLLLGTVIVLVPVKVTGHGNFKNGSLVPVIVISAPMEINPALIKLRLVKG